MSDAGTGADSDQTAAGPETAGDDAAAQATQARMTRRAQAQARAAAAGLWPIRRALTVAGGSAIAGLAVLTVAMVAWVTMANHEQSLTVTDFLDVLKLVLASVAGGGALVALVISYRKQRLAEEAHRLAEAAERRAGQGALREATKLHTDRFTTATAQLGSDSSAIQLAGVHALAGLADDAPTQQLRQTCIDVLCAFLRMPYDPQPDSPPEGAIAEQAREHAAAMRAYRSLREVRHTVIRVIGDHLRDDINVSWRGHDLDFTGVVFDGGDLGDAIFTADRERGLRGRVSFRDAVFTTDFDFRNAKFTGGIVHFGHARFEGGTVSFRDAEFTDGVIDFFAAAFTGGTVSFAFAKFAGGKVGFQAAKFTRGTVDFDRADFTGSMLGFREAQFAGSTVNFEWAHFKESGVVFFSGAEFIAGLVTFEFADGDAPAGLVAAAGEPLPRWVVLSQRWLPAGDP